MPNHLANETSPYLLMHSNNPVDWYPWGKEALEKAQKENKPILLSIGYSACHWCHVMAHESFEDEETAKLMNEFFVNIKVDREERPDLDKIYQTAHQILMQQGGGWPLTVFLTPDQVPFFTGTFFPKLPRYPLPSFKDLLRHIAEIYREQKDNITRQNESLLNALQNLSSKEPPQQQPLDLQIIDQAKTELAQNYDQKYGGFGSAPKFPQAIIIEFLLQTDLREIATHTLDCIAQGGIYDQIGGGFYRYTVDQKWEIPHFEKMLYDNALLLTQYAYAYQLTKNPQYKNILLQTGEWVMREMQDENGGYYSAVAADSEGHEGKYYLWDKEQLKEILSDQEYQVIVHYYNLLKPANFEQQWHLYVVEELNTVAQTLKLSLGHVGELLYGAKNKLLLEREKRIKPLRDEKILTAWNAMMIKGMLLAGKILQHDDFIASANKSLAFIKENLLHENRLFASYKDRQVRFIAYLDDYAFLIDALITAQDFELAVKLADSMIKQFHDEKAGGFFFTSEMTEKLIYRPKNLLDDAIPSGQGVAIHSLVILGQELNKKEYLSIAENALQMAWPNIQRYPQYHCTLLLALMEYKNRVG